MTIAVLNRRLLDGSGVDENHAKHLLDKIDALVGAVNTGTSLTKMLFVDGVLGNDTTGNGSAAEPYKTIGKALTEGGAGARIYVTPGTYAENVSIAAAATLELDGVAITGTLTVSAAATIRGGSFSGTSTLTASLTIFGTTLTGAVSLGANGILIGNRAVLGSTLALGAASSVADLTGGSVAGAVSFAAAGLLRSKGVSFAAGVAVGFAGALFLSSGDRFATTFGITAAGAANIEDAVITGITTVSGAAAVLKVDRSTLTGALVLSGADARVQAGETSFGDAVTLTNSADLFGDDCDIAGALDIGAASICDLTNSRPAGTTTISGAAGILSSRRGVFTGAVDLGAANAEFHSVGDRLLATLDLGGGGNIVDMVDTFVTGITTVDGAADQMRADECRFTGNLVLSGADAQVRASKSIFGALVTLTNSADLFLDSRCEVVGAVDVGAASVCDLGNATLAGTVTVSGAAGLLKSAKANYAAAVDLNAANAELDSTQDGFATTLDVGAAACLARLQGSRIVGAFTQDGAVALVEADGVTFGGAVAVSAASVLKAGKCRFSSTIDLLTAAEAFLTDCNVAGIVTQGADTTILHGSGCVFVSALTSSGANGVTKLSQCEFPSAAAARINLTGAGCRVDLSGCTIAASGAFSAIAVTTGEIEMHGCDVRNNDGAADVLDAGAGTAGPVRIFGSSLVNAGGGGVADLSNAATAADPNILDGVQIGGGEAACGGVPCMVKGVVRLGAAADHDADLVTGTALFGAPGEFFSGPLAAPGVAMHAAYPGGGAVNDIVGPWTLPLPRRTVQLSLVVGGDPQSYTVTGLVDGKIATDVIGPTVAAGTVQGRIAFDAITGITGPDPVTDLTMETGNGFGVGGPVLRWDALGCDGAVEAMIAEDEPSGTVQPTTVPNAAHLYNVRFQR